MTWAFAFVLIVTFMFVVVKLLLLSERKSQRHLAALRRDIRKARRDG